MKAVPIKVPKDFRPSARLYELSERDGIPQAFVDSLVNGFIFYWGEREIRKAIKGWNITFWNHVKMKWHWKQERTKKVVRTNPGAFKDWESPDIEKSTSTISLKERLKNESH